MMFTVKKTDSVWCLSFGYTPSYPIVCFVLTCGSYSQLKLSLSSYIFKEVECKQCWKVVLCCLCFVLFCFFLNTCFSCLFEFVQFYFVLPFPLQSAVPLWTPASFKQDISEEGRKKPRCFDTSPLLALTFHTRVSSGTGSWTVGSWLPTVDRSSGDALSWCNTKKFFKVLISLSFKCVYKPRSNWN